MLKLPRKNNSKHFFMVKYVQDLFEKLGNEMIKYNPYYNKELLQKAFLFAYEAHK